MDLLIYLTNLILTFTFSYYLFFIRKKNDLVNIGFFGYLIYFLPLYLPVEILDFEIYIIGWGIIGCLLFTAIFYDIILENYKKVDFSINYNILVVKSIIFICIVLSLVVFLLQIKVYGISDFFTNKQDQQRDSKLHILFTSSILIGLTYSFYFKIKRAIIFFLLILLFIFISGDRTNIFIAFFTIILLSTKNINYKRFLSIKSIISILFLLFLGIFGKDFYGSIFDSYLSNINFITAFQNRMQDNQGIYSSEPYHIIEMLKSIIRDDFRVDSAYLNDIFYQFTPNATSYTDTLHYFSNQLKQTYFGGWSDTAGVGATFWGEGLALFSIFGLFLYYFIYIQIILLLNILYKSSSYYWQPIFAIMGVYWVTYIHRNSLFQMISQEKKIIYIFSLIFIISIVIMKLTSFKQIRVNNK